MAVRGKRPKPTAIKKLEGNKSRRPLPVNEPEISVPERVPQPPNHLSEEALLEWHRQAPTLHASGILTEVDVPALAAYCQLYGRWVQAERALSLRRDTAMYEGDPAQGFLVNSPNGAMMQAPLVGVANTAARDMMRYAGEFGLTPSARARVQAVGKSGKTKAAKFFD